MVSAELDTTELLSLAIEAMDRKKYDDTLSLLKQVVQRAPDEARAHYLMGSVYAQIALFDRAEAAMREAINLDPTLAPARFQLGLIYITSQRPAEAEAVWEALDERGEEDALYLFKSGLLMLAKDDFPGCIALLEKGIARNQSLPSLNNDMEKILSKVRQQQGNDAPAAKGSPRRASLGQYADSSANDEGG